MTAVWVLVLALTQLTGLVQDQSPGEPATRPAAVVVARPEGRAIVRIEFEGLTDVDPGYLRTVVQIKPGAIWDADEITRACARLLETGKFEPGLHAEAREVDGQLALVFVVRERAFITAIDFLGNRKFKNKDLLKEIQIAAGSPINAFEIEQARDLILRKYREAGYRYASAAVDDEVLAAERRVLFRIEEGPRVKVRRIRFEGNASFNARRLSSKIETTTYVWLLRTGAFDDDTAARDAAAIRKYYVDRGYLNAQVGYRTEIENETDLTLVFQVNEGLLHFIKSVRYEGNRVFNTEQLEAAMRSTVGGPIDADILAEDRKRILANYGGQGYIYADVATPHVFDEEDGFVNLTVRIQEREQYRLGRIVVRGNRKTRDKVIRRELRFFPEEFYDTGKTRRAEQRLVETRLFKEATITPQGELPGVRDALVDVIEDDTTSIIFGIGVTSNSGVVGSITLEQRNFDLFDWPRTAEEFFKFRSFRGAGQTLRVLLEPGTELTRGRVEFREPYLFDKELGYNLSAYLFERGRDEYDEQRLGFNTSIDKRIRDGFFRGWAWELAARVEAVDIDDVDFYRAKEIQDARGNSWLTSLKGSILRDTTDSRWLPSEGDRFKFSWEQAGALGGDWTFSKLTTEYDYYLTLHTDTFDRKHVLRLGGTMGNILDDAPVFERFYGGGIGSMRGFAFRGISPRKGIADDAVGGDFLLLTNAEYSFPIAGNTLRGVTFLDMGTVEEDNFEISSWRASVGAGLRIYIKYFGPIPLAFDLAAPIAKDDDDDTQIFSFFFGATF